MGRRKKPRIVRKEPASPFFKPQGTPLGALKGVALSVEGLEALSLADGEGVSQERAAAMMGVSRPTFNRILAQARRSVALALANGWAIRIDGGDYAVDPEHPRCPGIAGRPNGCRMPGKG